MCDSDDDLCGMTTSNNEKNEQLNKKFYNILLASSHLLPGSDGNDGNGG